MKTTLVLCNKNESASLGGVIRASRRYVDEILVVDGHSTDGSEDIAKREGVRFITDNGRGKGAAMRLSIQKASGDILVFMDADGSHEPKDIPKLIKPIAQNRADLVLASRTKGGSDELSGSFEKNIRMLGSLIITTCIDLRFGAGISDSQNGFRAIRKTVAFTLGLTENIFTIEQELIMKSLKRGYRIIEIPSHESARTSGVSHIRLWTMSWRYVWSFMKNIL
jgi:dolichol-phosphate mannosyltransferase